MPTIAENAAAERILQCLRLGARSCSRWAAPNGYLLDDSSASDGAEGANRYYSSLWQRCPLQDEEAGMQRHESSPV